jgi:hypothetical protein
MVIQIQLVGMKKTCPAHFMRLSIDSEGRIHVSNIYQMPKKEAVVPLFIPSTPNVETTEAGD